MRPRKRKTAHEAPRHLRPRREAAEPGQSRREDETALDARRPGDVRTQARLAALFTAQAPEARPPAGRAETPEEEASIIAVIYALAISGILVVLAGCTGPVILRHPETGKTVQYLWSENLTSNSHSLRWNRSLVHPSSQARIGGRMVERPRESW